jgi:Putative restriction endonuclease
MNTKRIHREPKCCEPHHLDEPGGGAGAGRLLAYTPRMRRANHRRPREVHGWHPGVDGGGLWSTKSVDLNRKKTDYEQAGVREYVVIALRMPRVFWFVRRRGKFKELPLDADGIYRSEVFPGLWLDPAAMLRLDMKRVLAVVREGLATRDHANFVRKLAGG